MPTIFACPPRCNLALEAAQWLLAQHGPAELPRAVVFVPTRRAAVSLRRAFAQASGANSVLLPRMVPLTSISEALPALLGPAAFELLQTIRPAMTDYDQRYMLTRQVAAFEARRNPAGAVRLDQSLALAEELMRLQDECARHEVALMPENLGAIGSGSFAEHWAAALSFLRILAESWPGIEAALGQTTSATRETKLLRALAEQWRSAPPDYPVYAMGSTASHPATAALLATIAQLPDSAVFLPGLDTATPPEEWDAIAQGHPLHHLKQFLSQLNVELDEVTSLTATPRSVWQEALLPASLLPQWRARALPDYQHIKLVPCQQSEEEAQAIALLLREGVEGEGRTALITPDEGLMARVAAQLKRFGLLADQLRSGKLIAAEAAGLWVQLVRAIAEPERLLHLRALLHHSLSGISREYLAQLEPYLHRRAPRKVGQLPRMPEAMLLLEETARVETILRHCAALAQKQLRAQEWVEQLRALLETFASTQGEGVELLNEALEAIATAPLPPMGIQEFEALLSERLDTPWRDAGLKTHPRLFMLTPVEARLEQFDRVIFGNMQERVWPGISQSGPWLNLAARAQLGLPSPEEDMSLMAHDVLVHGNARELFLSWPMREEGAPTTRSRFVERLVTLLACHKVDEADIADARVLHWVRTQFASAAFKPATPPRPMPLREQRPARLPVSRLDTLFSDPYRIYAEFVLGLRKLDAMDAEPEPRDFGTLTHDAIHALTEHWNAHHAAADDVQLTEFANRALRGFEDEPAIALFWRARLLNALRFVNDEEAKRRSTGEQVQGEVKLEAALVLNAGTAITIHGKIDRLEQDIIGDYKTGDIPTEKEILSGQALQLLAYAMLCEAAGEAPSAIEYWQLPHARRAGLVQRTELAQLNEAGLPERLREALAHMLEERTPFLANPTQDGWESDYDGISRYDEWAG